MKARLYFDPCGPVITGIPNLLQPVAIANAFWEYAPHATPTAPTLFKI